MGWGGYGDRWAPYVSVGQRLANATKHAAAVAKKQGRSTSPVKLQGTKIATTFWGKAWCDNLTSYSDYSNRLPRGATYVRNGSVVDLMIQPRVIEAIVAGSETYTIKIKISPLAQPKWNKIKQECSASIDSLLDLLAGRFSDGVMQRLTHQKEGLFPSPSEIEMRCSCPDSSYCCKHLAAVMYGIGSRLDKQPELLFLLRDVDHQELVSQAVAEGNLEKELSAGADESLAGQDLGAIFGIELDSTPNTSTQSAQPIGRRRAKVARVSKSKVTSAAATKSPAGKKADRKPKAHFPPITTAGAATKNSNPFFAEIARQVTAKKSTKKTSRVTKTVVKKSAATRKAAAKPKSVAARVDGVKPSSKRITKKMA